VADLVQAVVFLYHYWRKQESNGYPQLSTRATCTTRGIISNAKIILVRRSQRNQSVAWKTQI
jgi:hypothetical protein